MQGMGHSRVLPGWLTSLCVIILTYAVSFCGWGNAGDAGAKR